MNATTLLIKSYGQQNNRAVGFRAFLGSLSLGVLFCKVKQGAFFPDNTQSPQTVDFKGIFTNIKL